MIRKFIGYDRRWCHPETAAKSSRPTPQRNHPGTGPTRTLIKKLPSQAPKSRTIVLVGISVRAAAQSAAGAGWRVISVDRFGDVDTVAISEQTFIFPPCSDEDASEVASQMARTRALAEIAEATRGIPWMWVGNPEPSDLEAVFPAHGRFPEIGKCPRQLSQFSRLTGIPALEIIDSRDQIDPRHFRPTDWVIKARRGNGGRHVFPFSADRLETVNFETHFLQAFARGTSLGATCLADGKRGVVLGICRSRVRGDQAPDASPFAYAGSVGPISVSPEIQDTFERIAGTFTRSYGYRGLFNIDAIAPSPPVSSDREFPLRLLEINPRMGASTEVIERSSGVSLVDLAIQILGGAEVDLGSLSLPFNGCFDKRVVYAESGHRFDLASMRRRYPASVEIVDLPATGQLIDCGEPICTLIRPVTPPTKTSR